MSILNKFQELLEKEIKWHENHTDKFEGAPEEFKEGFLKGLKHTKILIEKVRILEKEGEYDLK